MPYVTRNPAGEIIAIHREAHEYASEYLPAQHPEITAFLELASEPEVFTRLDSDLIRVLEDLIDVLIDKNVLRLTDLPVPAQNKLLSRKNTRARFSQQTLNLIPENDDIL